MNMAVLQPSVREEGSEELFQKRFQAEEEQSRYPDHDMRDGNPDNRASAVEQPAPE